MATRDHKFGKLENLFDESVAEGAFAQFGIEQTRHGLLHLIDQFVNNAEEFNLDAFPFGGVGGGVIGFGIKSDDDCSGGFGQKDIGFGNWSDGGKDNIEGNFLTGDFAYGLDDGFDGALDVALKNEVEALLLAFGDAGEKIFEGNAFGGGGAGSESGGSFCFLPFFDNGAGFPFCGDDDHFFAWRGSSGQADDTSGNRRSCFFDGDACVVVESFDFAEVGSADKRVAHFEESLLNEDGSGGTTAGFDLRFDDAGAGVACWISR